jgi:hypothetical protein
MADLARRDRRARGSARLKAAAWRVWAYVHSAPATFSWLAVLLVTTIVMNQFSPQFRRSFVLHRSTNLHELSHNPVRVLISSALWIDGGHWWPYLILYGVFHAPAERWLGTARWLAVVVVSHVGATYISQSVVYYDIRHGTAPPSAAYIPDIGVSYALAGVEGVLTFLIAAPWRYLYAAVLIVYYGDPVLRNSGYTAFTDIGHFTALSLGLACFPLARGRSGSWDPLASARAWWARLRPD